MSTSHNDARYVAPAPKVADGWRFDRLTAGGLAVTTNATGTVMQVRRAGGDA